MSCSSMFNRLLCFLLLISAPVLSSCAVSDTAAPDACQHSLDSPIQNFCEVSPGVLWRGAKPDTQGAKWLIEHGVQTIVNLELLHDDRSTLEDVTLEPGATEAGTKQTAMSETAALEHAIDDRATLNQTALGDTIERQIAYYRVRDWEPMVVVAPWLTDDHVEQFLAIMETALKPVYVHCRSGQNRTGVMVAAYQVILGGKDSPEAIEQVVADMQGYRGIWFKADAEYIRSLTPLRIKAMRKNINELKYKVKPEAMIVCRQGNCKSRE